MTGAAPDDILQHATVHTFPGNGPRRPDQAGIPWPEPDWSLIKPMRRAPPRFPCEVFGPWLPWINQAAEVKNAPPDYVALGLLTVAGSLLGNNRWVRPWRGWTEPPVLWGALVGNPSAGKSPALDAVIHPLNDIERELAREHRAELADYKDKAETARIVRDEWKTAVQKAVRAGAEPPPKPDGAEAGDKPVKPRLSVTDVTVEKMAALIAEIWRGALLYRDELAGWIGGMDRYGSGKGERAFWTEGYGGRSYSVDRQKLDAPIIIDHLTIGIIGGIQPDRLTALLTGDDDGALARFMVVWPEPADISRPAVQSDAAQAERAFRRLLSLMPVIKEGGARRPFMVALDEPAQEYLTDFRHQCRAWENELEGLMRSHVGKYPGMVCRIACVLGHLDWAIAGDDRLSPIEIRRSELERAAAYVGDYLRPMAMRAYGDAALPVDERAAMLLLKRLPGWVEGGTLSEVTVRNISRLGVRGLADKAKVLPALELLKDAGWVRESRHQTGGRPRHIYELNPVLMST